MIDTRVVRSRILDSFCGIFERITVVDLDNDLAGALELDDALRASKDASPARSVLCRNVVEGARAVTDIEAA